MHGVSLLGVACCMGGCSVMESPGGEVLCWDGVYKGGWAGGGYTLLTHNNE